VLVAQTLAGAGSPAVVTATGRIGPLRMDVSGRAAIVARFGRPNAERLGTFNGSRRYLALGYSCAARQTDVTWPVAARGPFCRTVFFLDPRDGRLGTFFTTSTQFREEHGVRIGMSTAAAEHQLHRRVYVGCEENISLVKGGHALTVAFAGGRRAQDGHLIGGHVYAFALHGRTHDVDVFDCM
jgi:hypothetical protein